MQDPMIRRLRPFDQVIILDHFQRLDAETLTARFNGNVPGSYVETYVADILNPTACVFGSFPDKQLRGLGELRPITDSIPNAFEVALTVETGWQHRGLGDALLSRLIVAARNRGIEELHMLFQVGNHKMQGLARKHGAVFKSQPGQVEATLVTPGPTPLSMTEEIAGEYQALARAILHLPDNAKDVPALSIS